jgi:GNAT superfamily N-acetyltransferase
MGEVTIRYYVTRGGDKSGSKKWGYWAPCLARRSKITKKIEPTLMAQLGFKLVDCGEDGPRAWAIAEGWNARWDETFARWRRGETDASATSPAAIERVYPTGSIGEGFASFRRSATWAKKKPRTREDWLRGWKHIDPVFGDVDPRTIAFEDLDAWYGGDPSDAAIAGLLGSIGVREAHRAMKIWRALWNVLSALKRDDGERYAVGRDPSLGIRRETPVARNAIWLYDEARLLVKRAWRMGYKGLAAALAVSWDTQFSPVDVRGVTLAKLCPDALGPFFALPRAKTGKAAIGTLSYKTEKVLRAYVAGLPFTLMPDTPIFHTRGGEPGPKGGRPRPPAPYTKDTLSKDFRIVREAAFPGDKRQVMDFRRSGAIEATAGQVDPAALAGKMANSIDSNRELQATYQPSHKAVVRLADAARARGRETLRDVKKGDR